LAADLVPATNTPVLVFACSQPDESFSIFNDSNGILYILVAGGQMVSATYYTSKLIGGAYYEAPSTLKPGQQVWGVWAAGAVGSALVQSWVSR
jgi:hypothetical protein